MKRHASEKPQDGKQFRAWLEEHPWIRHTRSGNSEHDQHSSLNNEILESKGITGYCLYYGLTANNCNNIVKCTNVLQ